MDLFRIPHGDHAGQNVKIRPMKRELGQGSWFTKLKKQPKNVQ